MLIKRRDHLFKRIEHDINITIELLQSKNIFKIKGPLGCISFSCNNNEIIFFNSNINNFFLKSKILNIFFKNLREAFRGVMVPWICSFIITGYNYKIAYSYKRHQLAIYLGFTYWIIIDLTTDNIIYLKTIKNKLLRSISRKFLLSSIDYRTFEDLKNYFYNVRSLLPYKIKGLIFTKTTEKLKIGKKVKYR
jgi:ribosomal protein L6P/L9E